MRKLCAVAGSCAYTADARTLPQAAVHIPQMPARCAYTADVCALLQAAANTAQPNFPTVSEASQASVRESAEARSVPAALATTMLRRSRSLRMHASVTKADKEKEKEGSQGGGSRRGTADGRRGSAAAPRATPSSRVPGSRAGLAGRARRTVVGDGKGGGGRREAAELAAHDCTDSVDPEVPPAGDALASATGSADSAASDADGTKGTSGDDRSDMENDGYSTEGTPAARMHKTASGTFQSFEGPGSARSAMQPASSSRLPSKACDAGIAGGEAAEAPQAAEGPCGEHSSQRLRKARRSSSSRAGAGGRGAARIGDGGRDNSLAALKIVTTPDADSTTSTAGMKAALPTATAASRAVPKQPPVKATKPARVWPPAHMRALEPASLQRLCVASSGAGAATADAPAADPLQSSGDRASRRRARCSDMAACGAGIAAAATEVLCVLDHNAAEAGGSQQSAGDTIAAAAAAVAAAVAADACVSRLGTSTPAPSLGILEGWRRARGGVVESQARLAARDGADAQPPEHQRVDVMPPWAALGSMHGSAAPRAPSVDTVLPVRQPLCRGARCPRRQCSRTMSDAPRCCRTALQGCP
jgi:hypothetical protein